MFCLSAKDNRWDGDEAIYRFALDGLPPIACVRDIGFGELTVHVAVEPPKPRSVTSAPTTPDSRRRRVRLWLAGT